jgi:putative aldouronate transport system substrate-binding protein
MKPISRRELLKVLGVTVPAITLAACQTAEPEAPAVEEPAVEEPAVEEPAPEATTEPPKGEPVLITIVESWFGLPQFAESLEPVNQAISAKMQEDGVNVAVRSMILDDHANKYAVLYASGADFTMAFDAPWYKMNSLRDQGALVQIEEMIKNYPNIISGITQKVIDANYMLGHMYGLPIGFFYSGDTGVIWREDLREKYGVEAPTSEGGYRSLEPYLEAIAKNEPDLMPFGHIPTYGPADGNVILRRGWGPGAQYTGLTIPDCLAEWKYQNLEDQVPFQDANKMVREWWEKGWINKTDLIVSGSTQTVPYDYFLPGKCASFQENEPNQKAFEIFSTKLAESVPGATCQGVDMSGMRAGKIRPVGALKQWNFIVFNSSAPTEQTTAAMEFYDWMYSTQDNMDMWLFGIEGANWKREDNMRYSEIEGIDQSRNYRKQWYVAGVPGRFFRYPKNMPADVEESIKFFSTESNWDFNPYEQFEPDTKSLEVELATLTGVWEEASHGLLTGQVPYEEGIAQFTKVLDGAGRQQVREKLQAQLDEFIANM